MMHPTAFQQTMSLNILNVKTNENFGHNIVVVSVFIVELDPFSHLAVCGHGTQHCAMRGLKRRSTKSAGCLKGTYEAWIFFEPLQSTLKIYRSLQIYHDKWPNLQLIHT